MAPSSSSASCTRSSCRWGWRRPTSTGRRTACAPRGASGPWAPPSSCRWPCWRSFPSTATSTPTSTARPAWPSCCSPAGWPCWPHAPCARHASGRRCLPGMPTGGTCWCAGSASSCLPRWRSAPSSWPWAMCIRAPSCCTRSSPACRWGWWWPWQPACCSAGCSWANAAWPRKRRSRATGANSLPWPTSNRGNRPTSIRASPSSPSAPRPGGLCAWPCSCCCSAACCGPGLACCQRCCASTASSCGTAPPPTVTARPSARPSASWTSA